MVRVPVGDTAVSVISSPFEPATCAMREFDVNVMLITRCGDIVTNLESSPRNI